MKKENKKIVVFTDDIYDYMQNNKNYILDYLSDNDIDATPDNIEEGAHALIDFDYDYLTDLINNFVLSTSIEKINSGGEKNGRKEISRSDYVYGCGFCTVVYRRSKKSRVSGLH